MKKRNEISDHIGETTEMVTKIWKDWSDGK